MRETTKNQDLTHSKLYTTNSIFGKQVCFVTRFRRFRILGWIRSGDGIHNAYVFVISYIFDMCCVLVGSCYLFELVSFFELCV